MSNESKPPFRKKSSIEASKSIEGMTPEEMQEELAYLRAENAYLKKLDALVQEKQSKREKKH